MIQIYGFAFIDKIEPTAEVVIGFLKILILFKATKHFILKHFGFIRETIYGGFWDFTANLAMADTAYTTQALKPHTDGCYLDDIPRQSTSLLHLIDPGFSAST